MGTCNQLWTTISPNFCWRFENVEELRSYVLFHECFILVLSLPLELGSQIIGKSSIEQKELTNVQR